MRDPAVEVAQERGAAGEDDAAVDDVGGELGRGALEDGAAGADDRRGRVVRLVQWRLTTHPSAIPYNALRRTP
jgi:hypothetical protein